MYPSKWYKLYRNRGGNKLLIKVFGNKEAFEEYNRGDKTIDSKFNLPKLNKKSNINTEINAFNKMKKYKVVLKKKKRYFTRRKNKKVFIPIWIFIYSKKN